MERVRREVLKESEMSCQLKGYWWQRPWRTRSSSEPQLVPEIRVAWLEELEGPGGTTTTGWTSRLRCRFSSPEAKRAYQE